MAKWEAASISERGELKLKLSPAVDTVSGRFSFCKPRECLDIAFHELGSRLTEGGMLSATGVVERTCNSICFFFFFWKVGFLNGEKRVGDWELLEFLVVIGDSTLTFIGVEGLINWFSNFP